MLSYLTINNKNKIYSDFLQEYIFNMLGKTFKIPSNYSFNIFEVTKEYIARPDLISYDAYGDTMHGDIICKLNGISNPFELNEGMKLIIPTADDITEFTIKPEDSYDESEKNFDSLQPISKTKQDKRQANESILGDSRFKIDSSTGIIIY
jgi:hypothetical protein